MHVGVPLALLDEEEPEQRGKVVREAGDEQAGDETEQGAEEGDGLGDDPADDSDGGDDDEPDGPSLDALDVAELLVVLERAVEDVAAHDGAVDGTGDEDDWQGNTECNTGDDAAGGEQSRRSDVFADEGVDDGAGEGVDEDFDQAKGPDGLDIVLLGVHLVHEGELADGERVREDDIGGGQERIGECDALRRPHGPVHVGEADALRGFDSGCDHGDSNGEDDGDEVDIAEPCEFVKCRRQSQGEQDDCRDHGKDQSADTGRIDNGHPRNGTRQCMRTHQKSQEQHEHDRRQLIAKLAPDQLHGIRVVVHMVVPHLDLSHHITGVDGDQSQTNGQKHTCHHSDLCESRWDTQRTQRDGLDNQTHSELHPA